MCLEHGTIKAVVFVRYWIRPLTIAVNLGEAGGHFEVCTTSFSQRRTDQKQTSFLVLAQALKMDPAKKSRKTFKILDNLIPKSGAQRQDIPDGG